MVLDAILDIVEKMEQADYEKIVAYSDRMIYGEDAKTRYNGKRALQRVLTRYGLTIEDFWVWENS